MTTLKDDGKVGDNFMNEIQEIATQVTFPGKPYHSFSAAISLTISTDLPCQVVMLTIIIGERR